jgi:peptidoglycan/LPS O-acetylase OafA/YrhL
MNNRNESLDLIRGLAALFVMLGHLRSIFFIPFQELSEPGIFYKVFYFFTGYGHECVIIFFVLSGYFVSAAFIQKLSTDHLRNHCVKYGFNRLTRLWVVLLPALVFTLLIDNIGLRLTSTPAIYQSQNYFQFIHPSNDRSLSTLLGNVFFLQTILVPTFGTNTPLWSLTNEFWYYLMFPIVYLLFIPVLTLTKKIIFTIALISISAFLYLNNVSILEGFIIWIVGFAAYYFSELKKHRLLQTTAILLFIIILILIRAKPFSYQNFILGAATGLLIMTIGTIPWPWLRKLGVHLSQISYTLYLIHLPLIIFLKAIVFPDVIFRDTLTYLLLFGGLVAFILIVSYGMYWLFERNTETVKSVIKNKEMSNTLR